MPSREQRVRVWRGEMKKTTGGLTKDDLVKNRKGKIVSRRKSRQAAQQNNLGEWLRNKGDRFEDTPQARAEKGLPRPKPKPAKKAPEPKPKRVPPALPKKKKKRKYEDDEDWAPPASKAAGPKALIPRPPKPLPKPRLLKAKQPKPKPLPKPKPRHKVARDANLAAGLKRHKKKVVLHAHEPQPEYVKFKEDLGKSSLKVAAPPDLYVVRSDPIVESAPIARNKNAKFADVSVSNIRRRSSRRTKRVDYSKYFDDDE